MKKGFKFNKIWKTANVGQSTDFVVYGGNLVLELILPNALKIKSFKDIHDRLNKFLASHQGKLPQYIRINPRQYNEYEIIFPRYMRPDPQFPKPLSFNGVPLLIYKSK